MDALVQSFVGKVQRHVEAHGDDESAIPALQGVLVSFAASPQVAERSFLALRAAASAFRPDVVRSVLEAMASVPPANVAPAAVDAAIGIVLRGEEGSLWFEDVLEMGTMVEWCLRASRRADALHVLVRATDRDRRHRGRLRECLPAARLAAFVEEGGDGGWAAATPTELVLVLRLVDRLVDRCPRRFAEVWPVVGFPAAAALSQRGHAAHHANEHLTWNLRRILHGLPSDVRVEPAPTPAIFDLLTAEAHVFPQYTTALLSVEAFVLQASRSNAFCHAYLGAVVRSLTVHPTHERLNAVDALLFFAERGVRLDSALVERLYRTDDEPTRLCRGALLSMCGATEHVLPHLGALLRCCFEEEEAEARTPSAQRSSPPSTITPAALLRAHVETHVVAVAQQPALLAWPLDVQGDAGSLLVALADTFLDGPAPAVLTAAARRQLAAPSERSDASLSGRVAHLLLSAAKTLRGSTEPHCGAEGYCRHLISLLGLDDDAARRSSPLLGDTDHTLSSLLADCVAFCPISLQPMHCPVVASDGNTYELRCLVSLFRAAQGGSPPPSPLTRAPLTPLVTFNRQLVQTECALWAAASKAATATRERAYARRAARRTEGA